MTTSELLEQWREATRAADLARRLAELATAAVERADTDSAAAEEIAKMAEATAEHAERAAETARHAATRAAAFAADSRSGRMGEADRAVAATDAEEKAARGRYHEEEAAARQRLDTNGQTR